MKKINKHNFKVEYLYRPIIAPFIEIFKGYKYRVIPIESITVMAFLILVTLYFHWDLYLFKKFGLESIYPYGNGISYRIYGLSAVFSPMYLWGWFQVALRVRLEKQLSDALFNAGIKNGRGYLPDFIRDEPIDTHSRKLTLKSNYIPIEKFETNKSALQTGLGVYIDKIKPSVERGITEIIYAHAKMAKLFPFPKGLKYANYKVLIGQNRSCGLVTLDFKKNPHILVAGETGGGKSYFLRQMIHSLYLNHRNCKFIIIDLKDGADYNCFLGLPRVSVRRTPSDAIVSFVTIKEEIEKRQALFSKYNCNNIDDFMRKANSIDLEENINLDRLIIVLDEAAELFLTGGSRKASMKQASEARKAVSLIARQGRSLGIHTIIATQRPDKTALDPQIKANLGGVICFRMNEIPSSVSAIGNKRATEIEKNPGRAVWKYGSVIQEVQTPSLSDAQIENNLKEFRVKEKSSKNTVIKNDDFDINRSDADLGMEGTIEYGDQNVY